MSLVGRSYLLLRLIFPRPVVLPTRNSGECSAGHVPDQTPPSVSRPRARLLTCAADSVLHPPMGQTAAVAVAGYLSAYPAQQTIRYPAIAATSDTSTRRGGTWTARRAPSRIFRVCPGETIVGVQMRVRSRCRVMPDTGSLHAGACAAPRVDTP